MLLSMISIDVSNTKETLFGNGLENLVLNNPTKDSNRYQNIDKNDPLFSTQAVDWSELKSRIENTLQSKTINLETRFFITDPDQYNTSTGIIYKEFYNGYLFWVSISSTGYSYTNVISNYLVPSGEYLYVNVKFNVSIKDPDISSVTVKIGYYSSGTFTLKNEKTNIKSSGSYNLDFVMDGNTPSLKIWVQVELCAGNSLEAPEVGVENIFVKYQSSSSIKPRVDENAFPQIKMYIPVSSTILQTWADNFLSHSNIDLEHFYLDLHDQDWSSGQIQHITPYKTIIIDDSQYLLNRYDVIEKMGDDHYEFVNSKFVFYGPYEDYVWANIYHYADFNAKYLLLHEKNDNANAPSSGSLPITIEVKDGGTLLGVPNPLDPPGWARYYIPYGYGKKLSVSFSIKFDITSMTSTGIIIKASIRSLGGLFDADSISQEYTSTGTDLVLSGTLSTSSTSAIYYFMIKVEADGYSSSDQWGSVTIKEIQLQTSSYIGNDKVEPIEYASELESLNRVMYFDAKINLDTATTMRDYFNEHITGNDNGEILLNDLNFETVLQRGKTILTDGKLTVGSKEYNVVTVNSEYDITFDVYPYIANLSAWDSSKLYLYRDFYNYEGNLYGSKTSPYLIEKKTSDIDRVLYISSSKSFSWSITFMDTLYPTTPGTSASSNGDILLPNGRSSATIFFYSGTFVVRTRFTFILGVDLNPPTINTFSSNTGSNYATESIISYSVSDDTYLKNATIYAYKSGESTPTQTNYLYSISWSNPQYSISGSVTIGSNFNNYEGAVTVKIVAYDVVNRISENTLTVYIDRKSPTISITQPTDNQYTNSKTIIYSGSDAGSGIDHYEIYVNGNLDGTTTSTSYALSDTYLNEGSNTIEVFAYDKCGNYASDSVTFVYDKTPPTITFEKWTYGIYGLSNYTYASWNPNINEYMRSTITLYISITDNIKMSSDDPIISGITYIGYEFSESDNLLLLWIDTTTLTDGSHSFNISYTDAAGNTKVQTITINVDNTKPDISITSPQDETYTNQGTITVNWSMSDSESGINHVAYIFNGGSEVNIGTVTSYQFNLIYGQNTITIKVYDNAGNVNSDTIVIYYDNIAPVVQITNDQYFGSNQITITWSYTEDYLDHFAVYIDGTNVINTTSTSYTTTLDDRWHTIQIIAVDKARNTGSDTLDILIDTIEPSAEFLYPTENYTHITNQDGKVRYKFNFSDDYLVSSQLKVYQYSWDPDIGFVLLTNNASYQKSASGEYYFWDYVNNDQYEYYKLILIVKDHVHTKTIVIYVYIDNHPPEIELVSPIWLDLKNGSYVNGTLNLEFNIVDQNISYAELSAFGDGATPQSVTKDSNGTISMVYDTKNVVDGGTLKITVKAQDPAGHYTEVNYYFTVDNAQPTIEHRVSGVRTYYDKYYIGNNYTYLEIQLNISDNAGNLYNVSIILNNEKVIEFLYENSEWTYTNVSGTLILSYSGDGYNFTAVVRLKLELFNEGSNNVKIIASDDADYTTEDPLYPIIKDTQAPQWDSMSATGGTGTFENNSIVKDDWDVTINLNDDNPEHLYVYINGTLTKYAKEKNSITFLLDTSGDTKYNITIVAKDMVGYRSVFYVFIDADNKKPTVNIISPSGYCGGNASIKIDYYDRYYTHMELKLYKGSTLVWYWDTDVNGSLPEYLDTTQFEDGKDYELYVYVYDHFQNEVDIDVVYIDNTPPEFVDFTMEPQTSDEYGTYEGNYSVIFGFWYIKWNTTDNNGVTDVELYIYDIDTGLRWHSTELNNDTFLWDTTEPNYEDGAYKIVLIAEDYAGNTKTLVVYIGVDGKLSNLIFSTPSGGSGFSGNCTDYNAYPNYEEFPMNFSVEVTYGRSVFGMYYVYVYIDGELYYNMTWDGWRGYHKRWYNFTLLMNETFLTAGYHEIKLVVHRPLWTYITTWHIRYYPRVDITMDPTVAHPGIVTLTFEVKDIEGRYINGMLEVNITKDSELLYSETIYTTNGIATLDANLSELGPYTVSVFYSGDGEDTYTEFTITIYDDIPPTIDNVVRDPTNPQYNDTVLIKIYASDQDSAIIEVKLNYTSNYGATWIVLNTTNNGSYWYAYIQAYPYGTNITYYVTVKDEGNNTVESDFYSYVTGDIYEPTLDYQVSGSYYALSDITINATGSEDNNASGIYAMVIEIYTSSDNITWSSDAIICNYSDILDATINFNVGNLYVKLVIKAIDNAGNEQYYIKYLFISKRSITIIAPANISIEYTDSDTLQFKVSDGFDNKSLEVYYQVLLVGDGATVIADGYTNSSGWGTIPITVEFVGNKTLRIYITSSDAYFEAMKDVLLIGLPEKIVGEITINELQQGNTLTISGNVTDNDGSTILSGTIEIYIYNSSWIKVGDAVISGGKFQFSDELPIELPNGEYQVMIKIESENYDTTVIYQTLRVAKTNIKLIDKQETQVGLTSNITITVTDPDGINDISYTITDGYGVQKQGIVNIVDINNCTKNITISIPTSVNDLPGNYHIIVYIIDGRNIESQYETTVTFTDTPLVIDILAPNDGVSIKINQTLNITARVYYENVCIARNISVTATIGSDYITLEYDSSTGLYHALYKVKGEVFSIIINAKDSRRSVSKSVTINVISDSSSSNTNQDNSTGLPIPLDLPTGLTILGTFSIIIIGLVLRRQRHITTVTMHTLNTTNRNATNVTEATDVRIQNISDHDLLDELSDDLVDNENNDGLNDDDNPLADLDALDDDNSTNDQGSNNDDSS